MSALAEQHNKVKYLTDSEVIKRPPLHPLPMALSVELEPGSEPGRPDLLLVESLDSGNDSGEGAAA
ncbi:hypothetical protein NEUTE2DRAFT_58461 [Neurospora tetrasperma FGSC 2509]|nr:hypothetical protein NEUTE2DRAFT_58461 [Neurospora tetrasperma FGSC 2509]